MLRCCAALLLLCCLVVPQARSADELRWIEALFHVPGAHDGLGAAVGLAFGGDGRVVYVAGRKDDAVAWFTRDSVTGELGEPGRVLDRGLDGGTVPGLDAPVSLALAPDGAQLYVVARNSNSLVALNRDPTTGALAWGTTWFQSPGPTDPTPAIALLEMPFAVTVDPSGACVHVGTFSFASGAVLGFERDAATGALVAVDTQQQGIGGVDVRLRILDLEWDPSGTHLYAASVGSEEIGGEPASVSVFRRDPAPGASPCALLFVGAAKQGVAGVMGLGNARDLALSPDGAHLYAVGGDLVAGGLVVFARDPATGALDFLDARPLAEIGADQPNGVAVTPDGALVLVVAQGSGPAFSGRLVVYRRDLATGLVTLAGSFADGEPDPDVDGLRGAFSVRVAPDGQHAIVASEQDFLPDVAGNDADRGALSVFAIPEPGPAGASIAVCSALAMLRHARRRQVPVGSRRILQGSSDSRSRARTE